MPFGSWKWCPARTRCHSIYPSAPRSGGRSRGRSARYPRRSILQWKTARHSGGRLLSGLLAETVSIEGGPDRGRGSGRRPLYSRKLHMRVRRARTSWETSLTIFALSLGESVVNHFARRCRSRENEPGSMMRWVTRDTYHFALARQEDQVAGADVKTREQRLDDEDESTRHSLDRHGANGEREFFVTVRNCLLWAR